MRVGTRGSALALAQARWVAERLQADRRAGRDRRDRHARRSRRCGVGQVPLGVRARAGARRTAGSTSPCTRPRTCRPSSRTAASSSRCRRGRIRATRSAGPPSCASCERGARVGTSSLRRAAQLHAVRPDLQIVRVRGNVDTRLRKLADGEADALVLALAGLERLGRADAAGGTLDRLVPAAGQGALALQAPARTRSSVAQLRRRQRSRRDGVRGRRAGARARARRRLRDAGRGALPDAGRRARVADGMGGAARRCGLAARRGVRRSGAARCRAARSGCSPPAPRSCWSRPPRRSRSRPAGRSPRARARRGSGRDDRLPGRARARAIRAC